MPAAANGAGQHHGAGLVSLPRNPALHRHHRGLVPAACGLLLALCGLVSAQPSLTLAELAEQGDRTMLDARLAAGAAVDERGPDGATALLWAAHRGDAELVARLLALGADPNARNDYGSVPLAAAAVAAHVAVIEALLAAGAEVDAANPEGQTALMVVARTGALAAAEALIAHGADVNARERGGGQSARMWAAAQRQPEMIRLLLSAGADPAARGITHDWERVVTAEPRIKIMHAGGFTPLLYAAREACTECIAPLIAGGADPDSSDPDGMTPLVLALLNRNFDTAAALIEHGADINRWDWWGRSPLFLAIDLDPVPESRHNDLPSTDQHSGLDIARILLAAGANVNMRLRQQPPLRADPGDRGYTDGSPDVLVITTGATALHSAAKASNDAAVRLLLEYGADVSAANVFGITPVLAAAGLGHWYGIFRDYPIRGRYKTPEDAIVTTRILLAAGADLTARSGSLNFGFRRPQRDGLTAAHGAAFLGWDPMLQFLHELGHDLGAVSADGITPRELALIEAHPDTAALINDLLGAP